MNLNYVCSIKSSEPNSDTVVYIGTGAGKQLKERIESARSEVLIVSPYVSPSSMALLKSKAREGLDVKIAFDCSKGLSALHKDSLKEIITQHRHTNHNAIEQRDRRVAEVEKRFRFVKMMQAVAISIFVTLLVFLIFKDSLSGFFILGRIYFGVSLLVAILLFVVARRVAEQCNYKIEQLKRTSIYEYSYQSAFDVYCINTQEIFLHSKLFLIDCEVAYIGSVNFTYQGFKSNLETRVKISERAAVCGLREHMVRMLNYARNNSFDIQILGRHVFDEPRY